MTDAALRGGAIALDYFRPGAKTSARIDSKEGGSPVTELTAVATSPCRLPSAMVVMAAQAATVPVVVLAWVYVLARLVHSYVHLGANRIGQRIKAYFASWLVLGALWLALVLTVALRTSA